MRITFFDINLDLIDYGRVQSNCEEYFKGQACNVISFLNLHGMNFAKKNKAFKNAVNNCELVLNDGVGIEFLCKLNKTPVIQNMNGTDLIPEIVEWASNENHSVFLLGSKDEVVRAAAKSLEDRGIKVAGQHNGYFDRGNRDLILNEINASGAEVLVLGMGMPVQEIWIDQYRSRLNNVRVAICGGAIIDYISGTIKRSPNWIIKLRLEWLFRMIREPRRLIFRNVFGLGRFLVSTAYLTRKRLFGK